MSADFFPSQKGLEWVEDIFDVTPKWTLEPDLAVAKKLASAHLPPGDYDILPFAEGAFNKLFLLSPNGASPEAETASYVMRVALPVDPYFKTASEVATLKLLSKHTSIPTPRVVAYDTSSSNDLGFEWILMTRLKGIPLKSLWSSPELLWEERVQLTEAVTGYIQEMRALSLSWMGSLYLADEQHAPAHWLDDTKERGASLYLPYERDQDFVVGPVSSIPFFYGNRIRIPADRGPWKTSSSWLESLLNIYIASTTRTISDSGSNLDEDDLEELQGGIEAAKGLIQLLPKIIPDVAQSSGQSGENFLLFHDDLSTNNILIDPATHRVTGIVDWEFVSFVPLWKARRPPQYLQGPEIDALSYHTNYGQSVPEVPPPPSSDEDEDEMRAELRERLEQMLLRRVFTRVFGDDAEAGRQERAFENQVLRLDGDWRRAMGWIKKHSEGWKGDVDRVEGQDLYIWLDE